MIHLDTSFLIRALVKGTPEDGSLREWLIGGAQIAMSAISWTEFLCGPVDEAEVRLAVRIVEEQIPYDRQDATLAVRLFNQAGRRRGSLIDCMIAASAIRAGAELATSNPADFLKLEARGLKLAKT